ncbi:MBOAT family O-acyltransferase [Methylocella silvestris]|uniref:Probable alginate O-acetylase AlgI n=1 Tax=Methylocella silvestris TaxID=199596 RepID=A0A2J7TJF7_METSI|nr:MBOAT family O-acyltransferase [Methylocella silvestris]PNG26895.1 acyltransferase [Methylocella silvestris]
MLFSSAAFIFVFLPVVLLGYHLASKMGSRVEFVWLAAASLFFYGYWDARYLFVLVGSILVNFLFAGKIAAASGDERRASAWLIAAVAANILLLVWYKYFFPTVGFLQSIGLQTPDWVAVALPLGISFFTFTQIAYLVDLSQGAAAKQGIISYVLFVTFFPHLIAGPIIHHSEMMPQFDARQRKGLQADDMALGMTWFILGLSKKVLLADRLGPLSDSLYAQPAALDPVATLIGVLAYAFQLYFDFSGYSDMALGLARMFSIKFPVNFNSPYKARNIIDFWSRWHMTLTRYLTAYLYNPISLYINRRRMALGKKISKRATRTLEGFAELVAFPTLATMFLAGIWHGAGLQFIVFGLLHGFYLTLNHAWRIFTPDRPKLQRLMPWPVAMALTGVGVVVGQVFFRASSVGDAMTVLGGLLHLHGGVSMAEGPAVGLVPSTSGFLMNPIHAVAAFVLCFVIVLGLPNTQEILGEAPRESGSERTLLKRLAWAPNFASATIMIALFAGCFLLLDASTSFLYFQF